MKYGNLTYLEIKEKIEEDYILFLPTGCTEQQGPHLTVDFDTWFAEELLDEISNLGFTENIKSMVAPVLPFGTAFEHVNYGSGYVNLPQSVFEDVLYHTLKSFSDQGFKKIIIWRGCGGHQVNQLIKRFNNDFKNKTVVSTLHHPFYDVWCSFMAADIPGGHADSFTTSITMYKHPEKVRNDLISNPKSLEPAWDDPELDFSLYSENGVIGDPTHASPELGEKLWDKTVLMVLDMLKKI